MTRRNGHQTGGNSSTLEDAPPPPAGDVDTVTVTIKDQASFEQAITDGVARCLAISREPKDLTAALKVAIEWREALYGKKEPEGEKWGEKLNKQGGNE
jgi:hypothetical protein